MNKHKSLSPSPWVLRFANLITNGGPVLDLACGSGRHTRYFLAKGHLVTAVDRDLSKINDIDNDLLTKIEADLENVTGWIPPQNFFGAVVVTNYLYRPILTHLIKSLTRRGILLYETFSKGNEKYGRPISPEYLLEPGELLEAVRGHLKVIAYEDVTINQPKLACVQRICCYLEQPSN